MQDIRRRLVLGKRGLLSFKGGSRMSVWIYVLILAIVGVTAEFATGAPLDKKIIGGSSLRIEDPGGLRANTVDAEDAGVMALCGDIATGCQIGDTGVITTVEGPLVVDEATPPSNYLFKVQGTVASTVYSLGRIYDDVSGSARTLLRLESDSSLVSSAVDLITVTRDFSGTPVNTFTHSFDGTTKIGSVVAGDIAEFTPSTISLKKPVTINAQLDIVESSDAKIAITHTPVASTSSFSEIGLLADGDGSVEIRRYSSLATSGLADSLWISNRAGDLRIGNLSSPSSPYAIFNSSAISLKKAVTIGETSTATQTVIQSQSANSIFKIVGHGTGGAYQQITEDGAQDWFVGIDNASTSLKFRPTSLGTSAVLDIAPSGNATFAGYTSLGLSSPAFAVKKLTGTVSNFGGVGVCSISHGLLSLARIKVIRGTVTSGSNKLDIATAAAVLGGVFDAFKTTSSSVSASFGVGGLIGETCTIYVDYEAS